MLGMKCLVSTMESFVTTANPGSQQEGRWEQGAELVFVALAPIQGILGGKFWRTQSLCTGNTSIPSFRGEL